MSIGWIVAVIIVLVTLLYCILLNPVVVLDEQPAQTSENAVFVRTVGGRVTYY